MEKASFIQVFKNKSLDIGDILEKEFLNLYFRVARCSFNCFDKDTLREALSCERECNSSIDTAFTFLKTQGKSIASRFDGCKRDVESVMEGKKLSEEIVSSGYTICIENLYSDLENLQKDMAKEFQYYK